MTSAAAFAAIAATLHAAHQLADHVLGQTDNQAANKAALGWLGWRHNLAHVGRYHIVVAVMLAICITVLNLPVSLTGTVAGLTFSATTHAILDRRRPVRWLLDHIGSSSFARLAGHGINGMYLADQSLHYAALWLTALLIATV